MRSDDRVTTFVERCRSLSVRSGFRPDFPQQHAVIDNRVPLSKNRAAFRITILLCETGESIPSLTPVNGMAWIEASIGPSPKRAAMAPGPTRLNLMVDGTVEMWRADAEPLFAQLWAAGRRLSSAT